SAFCLTLFSFRGCNILGPYNIEISVKLFFVLLEKTKVDVGENFSIAEHADSEDCIREHSMARKSSFWLRRHGAVSSLALENIERMQPGSIGCVLKQINLVKTGLINILPKLRIKKDCVLELLWLYASEKEHVAGILAKNKRFCVGRVENMSLGGYAVGVITKMSLEDCEVGTLWLEAPKEEHVAAVLKQEKKNFVGRVENMNLSYYAVSILLKLIIHEENTMESIFLAGDGENFSRILEEEDGSIDIGRIRKSGFKVPERIKRKLRYTLVDEEGNEIPKEIIWTKMYTRIDEEGGDSSIELGRIRWRVSSVSWEIKRKPRYIIVEREGEEVLEEEIFSQRGNRLE
ncbi:MAG: uncharacterized protein A8A55_3195, partial [Amphiamblys sp. WSBS2006]